MKALRSGFKKLIPVTILMIVLLSGLLPMAGASSPTPKIRASPPVKNLVINEFSSYGSASNEWVELYNPSTEYANYTDLKLTDQDGNIVNISQAGITSIPPNSYLVVHMGAGTNTSFSNGRADVYGWLKGNILNDDGDDILIYNGTYMTQNCQYIDYIAYYNGGPDFDVDAPPIGSHLKFYLYGRGTFGYIPAPGKDESASLVPNGEDKDNATDWYITRDRESASGTAYVRSMTPGSENVNILKVTAEDIAPNSIMQGNFTYVIKLNFEGIGVTGEYMKPMDIVLNMTGTATSSDVVSLSLNTTTGIGLDERPMSLDKNVILGNFNYNIHSGETQTYYLGVKLAKDADIFHNFSISLYDIDMESRPTDSAHNDEVYIPQPIVTKQINITPIDQTPPYVTNVSFDYGSQLPLGPGMHHVTIQFDEPMDTRILPDVTYGKFGYEYNITGNWTSNTEWDGNFIVNNEGPHGELTLMVDGAKDVFWNVQIPYQTNFIVDTEKPYIKDIQYSAVPPYPAWLPVNITITFSENVTGVNAAIKQGKHIQEVITDIYKVNDTVYCLEFNTQSLKTGNYTLWVYNATDIAGNVMIDFQTNFSVDTSPPIISYVDYKTNVVEGENVSFLVYATDNIGVKKVWAEYEYKGEKVTVQATKMGDYWTFQVVGGAVTPDTVTVTIYVMDTAGNVFKDKESITVIPWWQSVWWLWVIIAIVVGFIALLIYDTLRRRKLREQLGEELVSESLLTRISKFPKNLKNKKKKGEEEEEEGEEEYLPPPPPRRDIPPAEPPPMQEPVEKKEVPEVPYEDEYFEEETIEREE